MATALRNETDSTGTRSYPLNLWTVGPAPFYPQERIWIKGRPYPIQFSGGWITVHDDEEYDAVMRAMPDTVWEEDIPEGEVPMLDPRTGYAPRSKKAFQAHLNLRIVTE